MGQLAALRGMDATIHSAMSAAGIGETGTYQFGDADPVVCRVYVDQAQQEFGDQDPVVGSRTTIGILRTDVDDPQRTAVVVVDGVTWRLKSRDDVDQSVSRWVVTRE